MGLQSPSSTWMSSWPHHHLYVCFQGSVALENHLALRNFLRRDPTAVAAYSCLKKQLASQFPTEGCKSLGRKPASGFPARDAAVRSLPYPPLNPRPE